MAVTIIKEGQALDLNPNFTSEMKLTSPIYSHDGSQSISNTLPLTKKNNRLLDFPLKWENTNKTLDTFPVIIEDGSFRQSGKLSIHGGSKKEGISFNIGFDEAILYAQVKDKKLSEITLPVLEFQGNKISDKVQNIVNTLEHSRNNFSEENDLAVFPVVLKDDEIKGKRYQYIINPVDLIGYNTLQQPIIWRKRTELQVINGEIAYISVPDGYGVVPFIRVWKIIELIFEQLELKITENIFKTHRQLRMLCAIHNCVDSICAGTINYKYLMPDATVIEFIDSLFAKFGSVFFIDSNKKTVKIKLLDDILSSNEYLDLTMKKASGYVWTKIDPKQVKLKLNTGLKDSAPVNENFNDFLKLYNNAISKIADINDTNNNFSVAYELPTGRYFRKNLINDKVVIEYIGSDFFNWDATTNMFPAEEISGTDESIPMVRSLSYGIIPCFINELKHVNTNLASHSIEEKEKQVDPKLAFLFYYDNALPVSSFEKKEPFWFASSFNRDRNGDILKDLNNKEYTLSLTARSLFEHFWKRWDAVLRYSNQKYEIDVNISNVEIMSFETNRKVMIDNQPFLVEQLNYAIGKEAMSQKMTIRSLALKEPFDLSVDQQIPDMKSPAYKWIYVSQYGGALAEIKQQYDVNHVTFIGDQPITFPTPENIQTFIPPSELDYLEGRQEIRCFRGRADFKEQDPGLPVYYFSVEFDYPVVYSVVPI